MSAHTRPSLNGHQRVSFHPAIRTANLPPPSSGFLCGHHTNFNYGNDAQKESCPPPERADLRVGCVDGTLIERVSLLLGEVRARSGQRGIEVLHKGIADVLHTRRVHLRDLEELALHSSQLCQIELLHQPNVRR